MMEHKRDNMQIMMEILRLVRNGATKTRIVYEANLNFNMLKDKINNLMHAGMVIEQDGKYQITDKGREFLGKGRELQLMLIR